MSDIYINLAVEDAPSEVLARKLLKQSNSGYQVARCFSKKGFGYLKSQINNFNQASQHTPFFVLTDQDSGCPPTKLAEWLKSEPNHNLIFRIAVMEVESWIIAHRKAFSDYFSIPIDKIPLDTDSLPKPKEYLISLVKRHSPKRLREDIVPREKSTACVGPDYNNRLIQFIQVDWDVNAARVHSESLGRAFSSLKMFKPIKPA